MQLPEDITYEQRNRKTADDFYHFCLMNPELRFWQALRAWSGHNFIFASKENLPDIRGGNLDDFIDQLQDTFYLEGKDGKKAI